MPTMLENLMLEEVSLVDKGASIGAHVTLFKRDTSEGDNMSEVTKMSDDMKAKLKPYMDKGMSEEEAMKAYESDMKKADNESEDFKAEVETLKEQNENLRKALLEEGYKITKEGIHKKAPEEFIEYGGEQINKADVPAPILKALEEAEIEKADAALTKRAEAELPHFKTEVAKSLLVAVEKMDEVDMLMEALHAADKAFADKMEEFGKSDVDGEFATANDKMESLVKAHMEANNLKKSDYAQAYAAVAKTDEGREVLKAIRKGE